MTAAGKAAKAGAAQNNSNNNSSHPRNRWRCMQPRVCPYCWKTFSNSFNLKQHTVNVHMESAGVPCHICQKVVKNKWYLRKHLVTAHGAPLKRSKDGTALNKGASEDKDKKEIAQDTVEDEEDEEEEEIVVDDEGEVAAAPPSEKIAVGSLVKAPKAARGKKGTL